MCITRHCLIFKLRKNHFTIPRTTATCQCWTYYCLLVLWNHCIQISLCISDFRFWGILKSCFLPCPVYPVHPQKPVNCFLSCCVDLLLPAPQMPWNCNFFFLYIWATFKCSPLFGLTPPQLLSMVVVPKTPFSCFRPLTPYCPPCHLSRFPSLWPFTNFTFSPFTNFFSQPQSRLSIPARQIPLAPTGCLPLSSTLLALLPLLTCSPHLPGL